MPTEADALLTAVRAALARAGFTDSVSAADPAKAIAALWGTAAERMGQLSAIERRVYTLRQEAFAAYYGPREGEEPRSAYANGSAWGALATYDTVLSEFRGILDGTPGAGWEQTKAQKARCEAPSA